MAKCTNLTFLMVKKYGTSEFEKLIDITEYPDLGGEKEKIDVTTLSDRKKREINGIEDTASLAFKAWYEKEDYKKLLDLQNADKVDTYQLWFGENGEDGVFEWDGKMAVFPSSGAVNAAREMQFSITDEGEEALHFVEDAVPPANGGNTTPAPTPSTTGAAIDGSVNLLGMNVSDLQDNVAIDSDGNITGTLKAVTGYTGFSSDVSLQDGHYIAIKVLTPYDTARMKYGNKGWKDLDADGEIVLRVSNTANDLKVETTKDGVTSEVTYNFAGVTLE